MLSKGLSQAEQLQDIFWKLSPKSQSNFHPVSTTTKLYSLDKSRSQQLGNSLVSISLGLETLKFWLLVSMTQPTLWSQWSWSQDHKPGLAYLCNNLYIDEAHTLRDEFRFVFFINSWNCLVRWGFWPLFVPRKVICQLFEDPYHTKFVSFSIFS